MFLRESEGMAPLRLLTISHFGLGGGGRDGCGSVEGPPGLAVLHMTRLSWMVGTVVV